MSPSTNLPDFLCIGAEKAGTSWLDKNLRHHPDIWMPPLKELLYFYEIDVIKDTSLKARRTSNHWIYREWRTLVKRHINSSALLKEPIEFIWWLRYLLGPRNDAWYVSLFKGGKGRIKGEITPTYSRLGEIAVGHIKRLLPEVKIIFIMRNPIERAWSHAVMNLSLHQGRQLNDVTDDEFYSHFDGEDSRKAGGYLATLDAWGKNYSADQMFIGFLDDIGVNATDFLLKVYGFLGVSTALDHVPSNAGKKVFEGKSSVVPERFAVYLARIYYDDLCRLDERFGGHVSRWRDHANEMLRI